jgi:hypothetical protein
MVLMMTKEGVGKYQLLIYLTFCKEIKNPNNCIQLYIVLKKNIKWEKFGVAM